MRLRASTAGGAGLIPVRELRSHVWRGQTNKKTHKNATRQPPLPSSPAKAFTCPAVSIIFHWFFLLSCPLAFPVQGSANLFRKGLKIVKSSGFAGLGSLTTQFCCCGRKMAIDVNDAHGSVPIKTYLQKQEVRAQLGPWAIACQAWVG